MRGAVTEVNMKEFYCLRESQLNLRFQVLIIVDGCCHINGKIIFGLLTFSPTGLGFSHGYS